MNGPRKKKIKLPPLSKLRKSFCAETTEGVGEVPRFRNDHKIHLRGYYSDLLGPNTFPAQDLFNGAVNYESSLWNAFTDQHMPNVRSFNSSYEAVNKRVTSVLNKTMKAALPDTDFEESSYEPKVQLPYVVPPRMCPREVEILRRKKQFASLNLEVLLKERNIDSNLLMPQHEHHDDWTERPKVILNADPEDPAPFPCYLGIDLFDNTEYECRNAEEWIELGRVDETNYKPVPGIALLPVWDDVKETDKNLAPTEFKWVDVGMLSYNDKSRMYLVQKVDCNGRVLDHLGKPTILGDDLFKRSHKDNIMSNQYWVSRIRLMFRAEDPRIFADRVAEAYYSRKRTENLLRYELYVDCMPNEGLGDLDNASMKKMTEIAKRAIPPVKDKESFEEYVNVLEKEVKIEYCRTMNKIVLHKVVQENPKMFAFVTLPDCDIPRYREKGCIVDMPEYEFQEYLKSFVFRTLLVRPEVSQAITKVRAECQKVASMSLFTTTTNKPVRIEEFEQMQSQTTAQVSLYMKDSWIAALRVAIRTAFRDLGKGWFNLYEKNWGVYQISKMKRFMEMVKFNMQDALRYLVQDSLSSFIQMFLDASTSTLDLDESYEWEESMLTSPFKPKRNPLISVEIGIENGVVVYSFPLPNFPPLFVSLFDRAIQSVQHIPQLEKLVMEEISFPDVMFLEAVGMNEPPIVELRRILVQTINKAIIPMNAYAQLYEQFVPITQIDQSLLPKDLESKGLTPQELKEKIEMYEEMQENIKSQLPSSIIIGLFHVSTDNLKQKIIKKCKIISLAVLDLLAKMLRKQADDASEEYKNISRKLFERSNCIEEVVEKREWIKTIPSRMEEYLGLATKAMEDYNLIEGFNYNLSNEDFSIKWNTVGWPRKINIQIDIALQTLLDEEEKYKKLQLTDQSHFSDKIDLLSMHVANIPGLTDIGKAHEYANHCRRLFKELKEAQAEAVKYNSRERLFGMAITSYEKLSELMRDFEPYRQLWVTVSDWLRWHDSWMNDPLLYVDADMVEKNVTESYRIMHRCYKMFIDVPGIGHVAETVRNMIEEFKPHIALIQGLRNPGMKQRHWDMLALEIGLLVNLKSELTFSKCLDMKLQDHVEAIQKIAEIAGKEYSIEKILEKMASEWENVNFEVLPHKNTGTHIIKVGDDIGQMMDDHIVLTQGLSYNPFKKPFEEQIKLWEATLTTSQEVLDMWLTVQKQWLYLEPIFSSEDIMKQLPVESKRFQTVDRSWRKILKNTLEIPKVITICKDVNLLMTLTECHGLLEQVEKGLSEYLETKRMIFPRFYFLSDDELLEILSQTTDPSAVQPHLKKCFENIAKVTFSESQEITEMISSEGEVVPFCRVFKPEGNVEEWMLLLESIMQESLKILLREALDDYAQKPRQEWVLSWPGQLIIAGSQTYWSSEVTEAISESLLTDYHSKLLEQLDDLRYLVSGTLSKMSRLILSALIVIDVHARDVVTNMIKHKVKDVNDFEWISQLRYYWMRDSFYIQAVNAEFVYGFEYLGNTGRLVITPLTDRCYLTLTGALHLKFGGAPAGPAGTGKTETTKDLAKAMAIQCVVFNCSDQLDFLAMGKFFKGLASSGAWACFDEFNRIDVEVLSVVAQQITTIQTAQQQKVDSFLFEGVEINLKTSCAIFITMNPGYAGRTELPDNLKALFRPVAMMVPDYALIAEISLFSYGFSNARNLAKKIVMTFKLSSEQLSSQDHYDFGMRAVKSVISAAGNIKRQSPKLNEDLMTLRAIRDVNVPKFLMDDLTLFNGIVSDLFPNIKEEPIDYGELMTALKETCVKKFLDAVDGFVFKCIQLYETTVVRHGLMLVGPTGSGKTKCYEVLQEAQTSLKGVVSPSGALFETTFTYVINPKSITMGQLYGEFDLQTHEWTDGIISTLMRIGASATDSDKRWYMFDGPVDAIWIESMNSVLDDNKKLCLTSGEIIKLTDNMMLMFEVEDLAVASPATVSRCGMVYLEPSILGLDPFITCYLKDLSPDLQPFRERLKELFDLFLEPAIRAVRTKCQEMVASVDYTLTFSLIRILDCFFRPFMTKDRQPIQKMNFEILSNTRLLNQPEIIDNWFVFAMIWGIGSTCDSDGRSKFNHWMRKTLKKNLDIDFPPDGLVYDYVLDDGGISLPQDDEEKESEPVNIKWKHWMADESVFVLPSRTKFADIIVPTMDTIRSTYWLNLLLLNNKPILCVGPTGTGKTLTIADKLSRNMPNYFTSEFICFSAKTTANQTQNMIDGKLDKRRKGVYGPPVGKQMIFFIDDFNMPALDQYGSQPSIELVRQYMDFKGWYDMKAIGEFRKMLDLNFVCAMGLPGGGRNAITSRLMRHFSYLVFTELETSSMMTIFKAILNSWTEPNLDVAPHGYALVRSSITVYNTIITQLLPTPTKCHYTFNMRDLSKVFQGMMMADVQSVEDITQLLRLWYHENERVFADRLVNDEDRKIFAGFCAAEMKKSFDLNLDTVIGNSSLLYCHQNANSLADKVYAEVTDTAQLLKNFMDFMDDYNQVNVKKLNLVLFHDAIKHLCRILRIIRQPLGNALLLGVGGSGRQSLTKLASHMSEFELVQIELSKNYGVADWKEDLKRVMMRAGFEFNPIVFYFSDTQIKQESFLEDLCNILNSGSVPNVYTDEELEAIYGQMKVAVIEANLIPTKTIMFSFFTKKVRSNLHTVIGMSPMGEVFRSRLRQFPGLVNNCTIDWFSEWPEEALASVGKKFLENMEELADDSGTIVSGLITMCKEIHLSVGESSTFFKVRLNRHNYVTPTTYLELLILFKKLLSNKKTELTTAYNRTKTGLDKLLTTAEEVAILQAELEVMQPLLDEATKVAEETVTKIKEDTKIAEETRVAVLIEETNADMKAKNTQAIADDAQKDLNEALPALDAALASLKTLNKNDIVEVRALQRPPDGVKMVIEAVCIMKNAKPKKILDEKGGKKDDYWDVGKSLLVEPQKFLESLFKFDKDNISDATIKSIQPYIENEAFQPSAIAKVSKACTSICQWVRAMYKYHFVAKAVAPKREALKHAQEELAITRDNLAQTKLRLKAIKDGLEVLQERYEECVQKKEELDAKAMECQAKLSRADKLISGLSDEKNRWIESIDSIEITLKNIIGDVIIAAAHIAYLGAFTEEYRYYLVMQWSRLLKQFEVPFNESASLIETLSDPMLLRNWQIAGLPKDDMSIENGVIVQHSRRWPLFIDPQGQANRWIKNMEKDNMIEVVKITDKDFLRNLENSIRFGKPCLVENIMEEVDPALEPILLQETHKREGTLVIRLGDAIIPYHNDFKLYITTKLPNPHYTPEASSKVTLVNFTLSESGLEGQLLSLVVAEERPDLEDAKNQLLVNNAKMKMELKEIEDKILLRLSSSEGNPVDDLDLIQTLEASKVKSGDIKAKVLAAEQTERDIDETRGQYLPVATNTQILYFSVSNLNHIDPMYQYSLEWFITIFTNSIRNARSYDLISKRCTSINEHFTFNLYCNVCRSLFEKHKLLFAFLLSIRILQNKNLINREDYRFLLTGVSQKVKEYPNPCPEWLTSRSWMEILSLASIKVFRQIVQDFISAPQTFKAIFDDPEPHRSPLPSPWEEDLSDFQKILLIRCLRPDKLTNAMQDFTSNNLGEQFVEPQATNLGVVYKDSSPSCPIIFILSQGTDPAADLYKFAEEMKFMKKLISISLGQGQGPRAESMLHQGMERGFWVFFQNCHLSPSWMPMLEKLISQIEIDKVHKDFRLWLTSMPSAIFPAFILQNGAKMTVEPPRGIKANLLKAYSNFTDVYFKKIDADKLDNFKLLLFSLCLFHGVILERRKFGSLGFNISYEFTDGDLRICVSQLKMFLTEYDTIPYKVLTYTAGEINYGGRVTDDWDRRCMSNLLADFYNHNVLDIGHKFSAREEYFQIDPESDQNAYLQYIKSLPLNDSSEIFGLHDNANITFAQNEAYRLLNALLLLQPKSSTTGKITREQVVEEIAMAISKSIPEEINLEYVIERYPVMYEQSMNTVLAQEIMRYNRLLKVMTSSLSDIFKAIKGQVIMSEDLELMSDSIFNNQVPAKWSAKSYPSLKPLSSWVSDLSERIDFLLKWIENGIPMVFWISGFFFPQAFLTGTLQNYARQKVVPIDTISFDFNMLKNSLDELTTAPEIGCYIHGLFLEGARWDVIKFRLEESYPKELYTVMPCIWLKPVEDRKSHFSGIYHCPVYKTVKRAGVLSTTGHSTNFVFAIEIPTNRHQSHWVKRSVALLCALDY